MSNLLYYSTCSLPHPQIFLPAFRGGGKSMQNPKICQAVHMAGVVWPSLNRRKNKLLQWCHLESETLTEIDAKNHFGSLKLFWTLQTYETIPAPPHCHPHLSSLTLPTVLLPHPVLSSLFPLLISSSPYYLAERDHITFSLNCLHLLQSSVISPTFSPFKISLNTSFKYVSSSVALCQN